MTLRFDDAERRRRLAVRHRLVPEQRTDDVERVVDDLVAVHSSDPATVHLTIAGRSVDPVPESAAPALYGRRSVVRHHAFRRTLWVMSPEVAVAAHASATAKIAGAERRRLLGWLEADGGFADPEAWVDEALGTIEALLAAEGPTATRDLGVRLPDLTRRIVLAPGTKHPQEAAAHTRLLPLGGFEGRFVRTDPTGGWTSGEYRWDRFTSWASTGVTDERGVPVLDVRAGAAGIAARLLHTFGPITEVDLRWWTGWTAAVSRRALADVGAVVVELDGGDPGWVGADDTAATPDPGPWVALLPSLDVTAMGWKERAFHLDPSRVDDVFDRWGNAGHTVWADGRIVGAWAQDDDGDIRVEADLPGRDHRTLLAAEVERTRAALGDVVVRPRFPSPANRRLAGG